MIDKQLKEKLLVLINEATKPLDITYIAEKLELGWWPAYRLVTSIFLEEVQQHPEIMDKLPFVCLKSTKSLLVIPNRLLPYQPRESETHLEGSHP